MRALLISTYDLGRQPFGLASATAALTAAGVEVSCLDLAKQRFDPDLVRASDAVAFYLPMHTATRLAQPVIERVRRLNPHARLIAFGLYAALNAALLRDRGVTHVIGGEFEDALPGAVRGDGQPSTAADVLPRVQFRVPDRRALPPLERYATLQIGSERRMVGTTDASRGCKHRCRHCPIVPIYEGRFRIVPIPVVLADIRAQVAAGARHITFGDPDFLNGPRHAVELLRQFASEFPGVTFDVTIKVEHLRAHADLIPLLAESGCLMVTSAVESVDDDVLRHLAKGHTRADFEQVAGEFRRAGLTLVPTFVAFTPWTSLASYCDLLQTIDRLGLVDHVAPIQLAIRLLVPAGSRLLELDDVRSVVEAFSPASLTHPWKHPSPEVDALQRHLEQLVGIRLGADRRTVFARIWDDAHAAAGLSHTRQDPDVLPRAAIPYLNEPWYC